MQHVLGLDPKENVQEGPSLNVQVNITNPYDIKDDKGPDYYELANGDGSTRKVYRGSKEYYEIWTEIN